jgi:hypothetical protein
MLLGHFLAVHRLAAVGLLGALTVIWASGDQAEARSPRKQLHHQRPVQRAVHGPDYRPPYADIVVDDNSGEVPHAMMADDPLHPASLTKIMTLYLLFEQLEAGKLKLDTSLPVSTHAAIQRPVKLGLKANQNICVEDAIKGLVTKSANDAAAVVAEAIGGTEEEFATLMTKKARALGMRVRPISTPRDCRPTSRSPPPATRPFSAAPSSIASRSITLTSRRRVSAIAASTSAITTICSDGCRASTASRPATPTLPATI